LLQLHGLLLRLCLLSFELPLLVPHLNLLVHYDGDGLLHHGVEVRVDPSSNQGTCDRTTSEMRGLSPKIISGDSR
jgi:hypothetical protein